MITLYPSETGRPVVSAASRYLLRRLARVISVTALVLLPACQTDAPKEPRPTPPPAIAPGTVRLDVQVNSCDQTETGAASCELSVLHVTEYGSGAGSLPVGTVLNAAFGTLVLGTVDAPPDSIMATGRLLDLTLMRQTFPEGAPLRPAWRTVQIHAF